MSMSMNEDPKDKKTGSNGAGNPSAEASASGEPDTPWAKEDGAKAGSGKAAPEGGKPSKKESRDAKTARIEELETELAALKDNALRAMAEAENVRKRAEKNVQDANRYGAANLARDMLQVADNLQRALDAAPDASGQDGEQPTNKELLGNLREGVDMTLRDLLTKLESQGVKKLEPKTGDKFDHNFHQAMMEIETADVPPGHIAQVLQTGFLIHDRLLRAAMVGVARAPAGAQKSAAAAGSDSSQSEPSQDDASGKDAA